jgi:ATP-dependent protease ClpP protease subunit
MSVKKELPYKKYKDLSVNWNRAIHVNDEINENLILRLTPEILKLRQESDDPITVAINSPGGSLASLESLIGLLQGPTQFYKLGTIVTVVTNRAYSAAANLLSLADYSVALRHSKIIFHDVRFSGINDVTPSKALWAAKSLQDENDHYALKLANHIIKRLIWVYLDLSTQFEKNNAEHQIIHNHYKKDFPSLSHSQQGAKEIDLASFATTLYSKLSTSNQHTINSVMERLKKWASLNKLNDSYPMFRAKKSRRPGLLDGVRQLSKDIGAYKSLDHNVQESIKLMITLMTHGAKNNTTQFTNILDEATRSFNLIQLMNDIKHRKTAFRLMLTNKPVFFDVDLDNLDESSKKGAILEALPHAGIFWLFCVSLCRELFEGDHVLTPEDCQLLGLVDEVAGGGPVESRREFRVSREKNI